MITERLKIRKFTNNDLTELHNLLSSVFKRKLVNEILKGGGARNCKDTRP